MYRTSYGDMYKRTGSQPRQVAIPGYEGHIPGIASENKYGKSLSNLALRQLNDKSLREKSRSTCIRFGFNTRLNNFRDETLHVNNHRHGGTTIMRHHPCLNTKAMSTSYGSGFKNPTQFTRPTDKPGSRTSSRPSTRASGFVQNSTLFDGSGWEPSSNLHGDMFRTEYRNRFNQSLPFHHANTRVSLGQLKKRELNYQYT